MKQSSIKHLCESEDVFVYPVYKNKGVCSNLQNKFDYDLNSIVDTECGNITKVYTLGKLNANAVYFLGLGEEELLTKTKLYDAFISVVKKVDEEKAIMNISKITMNDLNEQDISAIFTEVAILGSYTFPKIGKEAKKHTEFEILANQNVEDAIKKAEIYASAMNKSRLISDMPNNYMTPMDVEKHVNNIANSCGLSMTVLGNKELEAIGAGALLGVNRGSEYEARLIVLQYNGANDEPYTALVGKGITFDSGGYNLKPSSSMSGMKYDMCGAANVIGAMEIIARRKIKANVYGILAVTENMLDAKSITCDQVLVSLSKKTIEVTNTDAEGRLVLCDAITYAQQLGANRIIDISTLTGACVVALGKYTGVFSNDDEFCQELLTVALDEHEKAWQLPVDEEIQQRLYTSDVADLVNSNGKEAGASFAACFLEEFIEDNNKWIHLDIAGSASNTNHTIFGKGATGAMIKTMAAIFEK